MLEPLKQYICDGCGGIIESVDQGWMEWITERVNENDIRKVTGFKIIHHSAYSPIQDNLRGSACSFYRGHKLVQDMHLDAVTGEHAMPFMLSFIDIGIIHRSGVSKPTVKDFEEWSEIVRRISIPHYEEARTYFYEARNDGFFDGVNEIWPYLQRNLLDVINKYSDSN